MWQEFHEQPVKVLAIRVSADTLDAIKRLLLDETGDGGPLAADVVEDELGLFVDTHATDLRLSFGDWIVVEPEEGRVTGYTDEDFHASHTPVPPGTAG